MDLLGQSAVAGNAAAPPLGPTFSSQGARALTWISAFLSLFFATVLIYTTQVDGSPFRSELLTPWMNATLVDYYLTLTPMLLWLHVREASTQRALAWGLVCCCTGSVGVWGYVWLASLRIRGGDPIAKLLLGSAWSR